MIGRFFSELKRRNVVRVAGVYVVTAWGVFQIAKTVFETLRLPDWTTPLVLVLLALGLPITLIISWAFERGPDGALVRTQPAEGPIKARFTLVDGLLLGAMALVLGISVAQMTGLAPAGAERATVLGVGAPDKSVAVLPFVHFSAQQDSEYFADGLTEEVINSLAQVPDLKVAGRTSAFYFKGKNEDLREIGRRLGVAHVVEGSVRQNGDQLRVTAQLISVKDGFHLWSKTYDRKMDDAFAIQTEIANAVADALKARLETGGKVVAGRRDPAAYQLQLTARAHLRRWGLEDLQDARKAYERLTVMEPNNASAYAGYAQATILLAQNHLALDFDEARRVSEGSVDKALEIDPKSVDGYIAKAMVNRVLSVRIGGPRYLREEGAALERALALSPRNSEVLTLYAVHLANAGHPKEAMAYARRSLEVDPLDRVSQMILATALRRQGQFDKAAAQYRAVIDLYPDFDDPKLHLGTMLIARGRLDQAEPWLKAVASTGKDPGAAVQLANLYVNLGLPADADNLLSAIRSPPPAVAIAQVARLAAKGDYAGALALSERQLAADQDPFWRSAIILAGTVIGENDKALAQIRITAPELFSPEPGVSPSDLGVPLYASHLLNAAGDRAQARRILDRILAVTTDSPGDYTPLDWRIIRTKAFAELGEKDKAIAELQAAVNLGWRTPFDGDDFVWLDRNPNAQSIADDPRFKALMAQVRADLARQRANVMAARR